jgi:hypothetical protein
MNTGYEQKYGSGDRVLVGYIMRCAREYGSKVWAEAIVKLCRWGEYKPGNLVLGQDINPNIFNLEHFTLTTYAAAFTTLPEIKDEDGRSYYAAATIVGSLPNKDGVAKEFYTGLLVSRRYDVQKSIKSHYKLVSLFDLIYEYLQGNQFISGLQFANGLFEMSDELSDTLIEHPILNHSVTENFTSGFMRRLVLRHNIKNTNSISSVLTKQDLLFGYMPGDKEYIKHLSTFSSSEGANAVGGCLLAINKSSIDFYDEEILGARLPEILNDYLAEVYPYVYGEMCALFDGVRPLVENASPTPAKPETVESLKRVSVFEGMVDGGAKASENEEEELIDVFKDLVYAGDITALTFKRFIYPKEEKGSDGTPSLKEVQLGWVCTDPVVGGWLFGAVDEVTVNPLTKTTDVKITETVSSALLTLLLNKAGKDVQPMRPIKFVSADSLPKMMSRR